MGVRGWWSCVFGWGMSCMWCEVVNGLGWYGGVFGIEGKSCVVMEGLKGFGFLFICGLLVCLGGWMRIE